MILRWNEEKLKCSGILLYVEVNIIVNAKIQKVIRCILIGQHFSF